MIGVFYWLCYSDVHVIPRMQLEIPFYLFVLLLGCLLINFGQKGIVNNHEGVGGGPICRKIALRNTWMAPN